MIGVRNFHTYGARLVRIKESLHGISYLNVIKPPLSKTVLKKREEQREEYRQRQSEKPLTRNTAKQVIEKKLNITLESLSPQTKFTETQLNQLFKNPNKRLIYSVLGTSASQLRDAEIVNADVKKLLARNEISKAIFLCKLAQKKGVVGMNMVMDHLLQNGDSENAISLFNYRKKWGIQPNEFTYSILFEGLSNQQKPANKKTTKLITRILENLQESGSLSPIHLNTALKALFNSTDPQSAVGLFEKIQRKDVHFDNKLFTVYFSGLSKCEALSDNFIVEKADESFQKAVNVLGVKQVDAPLITAYAQCFIQRSNLKIVARSINILRAWFDICDEDQITSIERFSEPRGYRHQKLEAAPESMIDVADLNPFGKRLPVNNYVLDMYISVYRKMGSFKKAAEAFTKFAGQVEVDTKLYNSFLISVTKMKSPSVSEGSTFENPIEEKFAVAVQQMNEMKVRPNFETNIVIYKFLEKKVLRMKPGQEAFLSDFILKVYQIVFEAAGGHITLNQTHDFLQLLSRIGANVAVSNQLQFLGKVLLNDISKTQILGAEGLEATAQTIAKVKSLEITALTILRNMITAYKSQENRIEATWSAINRFQSALQSHVNYIDKLSEIEDPGYDKLRAIEEAKELSIKQLVPLIHTI